MRIFIYVDSVDFGYSLRGGRGAKTGPNMTSHMNPCPDVIPEFGVDTWGLHLGISVHCEQQTTGCMRLYGKHRLPRWVGRQV